MAAAPVLRANSTPGALARSPAIRSKGASPRRGLPLAALLLLPAIAAPALAAPSPVPAAAPLTRTFAVAVGTKTKQLLTLRLSAKDAPDVRSKTHVDIAIGPNENVVKQTLSVASTLPRRW